MAAPRADRRLAAILAADVVGYSRLMQADEDGTLARLKRHRQEFIEPLIAEHRGRIVKLMGDGALCEFGSVVDAVACAVAIQRGMAEREAGIAEEIRLRLRIGINLGDIIHEADGDIYGDGVNLAARLEGLAEPGGICISQPVEQQLRARPGITLQPMGAHRVKNVAEPLQVWRVVAADTRPRSPIRGAWSDRRAWMVAACALLAAMVLGSAWWQWWPPRVATGLRLPDKPSIAVLPFDNLSGDERLGRLADGLVDDVITDLSRFRELFVIARNSSFAYRGKSVDVREIGSELGVRYVLEGSVQSGDDRLRLTAQLIDAQSGAHIWSERYDRPLGDLFAVQADVTERIVGMLGSSRGVIQEAGLEAARRRPPQSLEAYDLYLLGTELRLRLTPEDHAKSMELLHRAIELDPLFETAWVGLALGHWNEVDYGWAPFAQGMENWLVAARRAVELDPGDALAHTVLGLHYGYANDFERNLAEFDAALNVNPNHVLSLNLIAGNLAWLEPPGRAVELIERAARLNPNDQRRGHQAKLAYYFAGRFDESIVAAKCHGDLSFFDYQYLAMSYAELGRVKEAKENASAVMRLKPMYSVEWALTYNGEFAPAAAGNRALFIDGLTKAGLPHCATAAQIATDPGIKNLADCDAERAKAAAAKT